MNEPTLSQTHCPHSPADLRQQLHEEADRIADYCETCDLRFLAFENQLKPLLWALARLACALFLVMRQQRLQASPQQHPGFRFSQCLPRTLRTMFGEVRYWRDYWVRKKGKGGFHPLDAVLGLTSDGFSPLVMSMACRLTTYLSYAKTTLLLEAFWGWSPSTETVEQWTLGVARQAPAYMASPPPFPEADGEVLVIEIDGKAVPTATEEELKKRRGPRRPRCDRSCKCQRHRGRAKRRDPQHPRSKKRRKKGDKSKNGKSATLAAIYTLRRGADGKLHGPINKRVWGSFASRKKMLAWVRAEATRRGFGPETTRLIQIVVDGERCFAKRLRKLFPKAIMTLDIRHVEERIWKAGRAFHREGSDALKAWVDELRAVLYRHTGKALVARLRRLREGISCRGPGTKRKRAALDDLIGFLEPRTRMMRYAKWIKEDLVIATGVIEGAVRYVIGERLDCSGMRWVKGKAEAILHLRCIEVNGEWDDFFAWCQDFWCQQLARGETVRVGTDKPIDLQEAA